MGFCCFGKLKKLLDRSIELKDIKEFEWDKTRKSFIVFRGQYFSLTFKNYPTAQ